MPTCFPTPMSSTGLDSIVRSRHPRLQIILAARSDPLLPLHRYRLAGQVFELRAAGVPAMTHAEMHAVLAAHGVTLPQDAFDVLASRTEGWTAGVRLSAMRMEGTRRPADFVADFAIDQGSIGEYLMYEVLDRLPEPERRMLHAARLPRCRDRRSRRRDHGIDRQRAGSSPVGTHKLLVIPLDAAHTRFRYHHLLTEILRYILQRQGLDTRRMLFRRAASWFEGNGDLQNTVHWAASARDEARALSLLARGVMAEVFVRGANLTPSELINLMPAPPPVW